MVYRKLARNDDIGPETGLIQGAYALDAAAVVAEQQNDVEGLLNAAAMWMKFTDAIVNFSEHVEQEKAVVKSTEAKFEVGFQRHQPEEDTITVEEEDE